MNYANTRVAAFEELTGIALRLRKSRFDALMHLARLLKRGDEIEDKRRATRERKGRAK
jgi:hypothetical protein